ncbi:hypothetical protein DBR36_03425 [Microbacterium sp. HMWF026]|uniref:hypothetical protein n=1 Tax=Microbacterium sp. HMWF026 TaxID=2056861 RepID=UPI000D345F43|nr:hypothetical protein [Microbacterium sp. HMWF026]PTT21710.1 hypothetical protein DBR36_03425 [Microbacterium sp. HMWF026]
MDTLFDTELEVPKDDDFDYMAKMLASDGIFQLSKSDFEWTVLVNIFCELSRLACTLVEFAHINHPDVLPQDVSGLRLREGGVIELDIDAGIEDQVLTCTVTAEAMPFAFFRLREAIQEDAEDAYCMELVENLDRLLGHARSAREILNSLTA